MARAYSSKGGKMAMAVFYNVLNLAGINVHILLKEQQQQESPEESPAAAGRGAEGRIHGGERGCGSRHKVGSSGNNHCNSSKHRDGGAGLKDLQTEPNVRPLTSHKSVCGNCAVALQAAASPPQVVQSPQLTWASSALHLLLVTAILPPNVLTALWTNSTLSQL